MNTSRLADVAEDVDEVRRELSRLRDELASGPYVRRELHDEQIRDLREAMKRVTSHAQWTFGLLASSIISAVVVFAIAVAQGG
jgi:hypothetical protein